MTINGINQAAALTALQTEMRGCSRCLDDGHAITAGAVFSGSTTARVLLIGQAPGVTEVTAKRPFNASSGRRLFQWLAAAGWEEDAFRQQQYMTAVTKCYPGKNSSGRGDRVPGRAEQLLCRPFLEQEIRLVQPRLLIVVGGLAIKLFYPAGRPLREIIGTGLYYPPATLTDPLNFELAAAAVVREIPEVWPENGRFVVPLPHPSGASLWPNKPANQALISRAIQLLAAVRTNGIQTGPVHTGQEQ